jgi:hypothetical protein
MRNRSGWKSQQFCGARLSASQISRAGSAFCYRNAIYSVWRQYIRDRALFPRDGCMSDYSSPQNLTNSSPYLPNHLLDVSLWERSFARSRHQPVGRYAASRHIPGLPGKEGTMLRSFVLRRIWKMYASTSNTILSDGTKIACITRKRPTFQSTMDFPGADLIARKTRQFIARRLVVYESRWGTGPAMNGSTLRTTHRRLQELFPSFVSQVSPALLRPVKHSG